MSASGLRYELNLGKGQRLVLIDADKGVELQVQNGGQTLGAVTLKRSDARHVAATLRLMGDEG